MKRYAIISFALLFSTVCWADNSYDYPIDNPLAATVIGTPKAYTAKLPNNIPRSDMTVVVFPDREVKKFIPRKELHYTLVRQRHSAPLVFSIAGTGASHRSAKMKLLEKAFYQAGLHVVSLPSPTYANFIVTASTNQVPGHIVHDSADLYQVMRLIEEQISDNVDVTEFYITGYSLGGAQAAFVAKLDEEHKVFNFKKVLMINPPVSLFNSVSILDRMLEENIPGGADNFNAFFADLMEDFTKVYIELENLDFNDDFLYRVYKYEQEQINLSRVAATIGISFRLASSNMIFTSDLLTNGGYILPKNHELGKTESTTDYFKVANRISFTDYFNERFYPFFSKLTPGTTRKSLMYDTSLNSIADYLRSAKKITVIHNEDDIILAPGEIDFFRDTFQSRAHIYPKGGHCGNMAYKDNVDYMINYFTN
ncbi:MAG TPA: alpha/beta hydrolase [Porticoccus sp.]|nr:alpha/beta hydrolase [Porticoccus sp.]